MELAWLAALRDPRHPQADELCLRFPVSAPFEDWVALGMPYPFDRGADEPGYHDVVIGASRDFVRPLFGDAEPCFCICGTDLSYAIDERKVVAPIETEGRVRSACLGCGASFDPNRADTRERAIHRFSVAVDCQEGWPREPDSQEHEKKAEILRRAGYDVSDIFGRPIGLLEPRGETDAVVVRSPYGDAAPRIDVSFRSLVEDTIATSCDVIPEFT
jgi:hypothetical protein